MERFRFLVVDRFYADASEMRRFVERRLSDTRDPFDKTRFLWESWHVPGQFSQLRVPAHDFFGPERAQRFEAALCRHVTRAVGPVSVASQPWVSILLDGHFQSLHRDSPNGDFAFSFGLGKEAKFRGGETLIARDELLDYFGSGAHRDGAASEPLFDEVASKLNRLVVFDARLPHAVREVEGPREAREGRIAVQGWLRSGATGARSAHRPKLGVEGIVAVDAKTKKVLAHTLVPVVRGADVARALRVIAKNVRETSGVVTLRL